VNYDAIIIGGGMAGLCSAIKLDAEGFDWVLLERQDRVGGTWAMNTYPGVGVDTPTPVYSYSFHQSTDWTRTFPGGSELQAYTHQVAEQYGLLDRICLNTTATSAVWDGGRGVWEVSLADGEVLTARHLVGAWGIYTAAMKPDIPGLAEFAGDVYHTAAWPQDAQVEGRRVGVIGTGASAVQLVPAIAPDVERLTVFQRSAVWVNPRLDVEIPPRVRRLLAHLYPARLGLRSGFFALAEAYLAIPLFVSRAPARIFRVYERLCRMWIRRQVEDPALREALTPDYPMGCKRVVMSNKYLSTYNRSNVDLVTAGIDRITPRGVVTTDGVEHKLDALVLSTGFRLWSPETTPPLPIIGKSGEHLGDRWAERGYRTYRGVSVADFPNLWITGWGPQGLAGPSYTFMVELNVTHMMRCLREARRRGAPVVQVRDEAFKEWSNKTAERMSRTSFFTSNCAATSTFYFDHHGEVPVFRPSLSAPMWVDTRRFALDDYRYEQLEGPQDHLGAGYELEQRAEHQLDPAA
jgi:cation diffusion facilitator CzcD-associated flavoprotein CzcO